MITGSTRVAAVIGSPVHHSLSPALHNAAFRQLGVDWVYVAFHVPHGDAQRAIRFVRAQSAAWKLDPQRIGIIGFAAERRRS